MSEIVLKDIEGVKQTYSGVKIIRIADSSGKYNNYVSQGDAYALFGTWDLPEKTVMYDALQGLMPDGTTVDNKFDQDINFDVQVYYYSEGEYYYSEDKITGFTGFSTVVDNPENPIGNFYYKKGNDTTVQTFSAYYADWINLTTDSGDEVGAPRRIIFGNAPQVVSGDFYNWFTAIAVQIDGGGESNPEIPEISEPLDLIASTEGAEEGEIAIAYNLSEKVALPVGTNRPLGTLTDENFKASNIKKDVEIFGVTGDYEGEVIPNYTEVEDFLVFLDEPDEGTLTVAYSTPQDVKLPVPSGGAQAVRLASVDDENFKVNNIKKGVSIFGLVGAYEGEVIPEISEVESFTLYTGTADEGSLEIGYDVSERVALPEGSHLLASIEDANYTPSNIKKGANIFGLVGEYEGEAPNLISKTITENGTYKASAEVGDEDELQGTWLLPDYWTYEIVGYSFKVSFTSGGSNYNTLNCREDSYDSDDNLRPIVYYDTTLVYTNSGQYTDFAWTNQDYRTINITSKLSEVTNGGTLLTYLKKWATKQATTTTIDGYSEVVVNVEPELEEITITENGEYTPSGDGFSKVIVAVPSETVEEWDGTGVVIEEIKTEETTDELAGTWAFGDGIGVGNKTWNVNYTSNSESFNSIEVKGNPDGGAGVSLYYIDSVLPHRIEVANDLFGGTATFISEAYRTINITSKLSEVTNGDTLLEWLKANATKQ